MNYYIVEPEVAGGFGRNTILEHGSHPPVVTKLHYELDGWLGDELLESFPCFIVTRRIRGRIEESGFTGAEFAPVEVTTSEQFRELYPHRDVPVFDWLKIVGTPGIADFGLAKDHRLVLSERALRALELKHCAVAPFVKQ